VTFARNPGDATWNKADSGNGRPIQVTKLLLLIAVLAVVIWFIAGQRKTRAENTHQQTPTKATENIVVCAHCHLHVPESESAMSEGRHYCCDEHRKLGPS
jgi:uncharacterized protein